MALLTLLEINSFLIFSKSTNSKAFFFINFSYFKQRRYKENAKIICL